VERSGAAADGDGKPLDAFAVGGLGEQVSRAGDEQDAEAGLAQGAEPSVEGEAGLRMGDANDDARAGVCPGFGLGGYCAPFPLHCGASPD